MLHFILLLLNLMLPDFALAQGCGPTNPNCIIPYSPPGASGPPTTVQSYLNRQLWANDFGTKSCNGSTNDTAAFNNAITEAQTLKVSLRFFGNCQIPSGGLNITGAIDFGGISDQASTLTTTGSGVGSQILVNTTSPVQIHDYGCTFTAPTGSDFCFQTTTPSGTNFGSRIWNVTWTAGIAAVIDKWGVYVIHDSLLSASGGFAALIIRQNTDADQGDMTVYATQLVCSSSSGVGLDWEGGGGLRFENNKVIGSPCTASVSIAFQNVNSGENTGDMFFIGNSLETPGNCFNITRASGAGSVGGWQITGNEGNCDNFINIPTDGTGQWIQKMQVTGNSWASTGGSAKKTFATIDSTTGLVIGYNTATFNSSNANNQYVNLGTAVGGGAGSTNAKGCVIGPNSTESINSGGTVIASTTQGCTTIAPF